MRLATTLTTMAAHLTPQQWMQERIPAEVATFGQELVSTDKVTQIEAPLRKLHKEAVDKQHDLAAEIERLKAEMEAMEKANEKLERKLTKAQERADKSTRKPKTA